MKILIKDISKLLFIGISATLMLSGCGKSAVKCDNNDAKNLVMDIVAEEMKKQIVAGLRIGQIQWNEELIALEKERGVTINDYPPVAEKMYIESNAQLINIRTDKLDNDLEKSECSAEVQFANGNKTDLTYKLSKTSDGKLYAEVFGLR